MLCHRLVLNDATLTLMLDILSVFCWMITRNTIMIMKKCHYANELNKSWIFLILLKKQLYQFFRAKIKLLIKIDPQTLINGLLTGTVSPWESFARTVWAKKEKNQKKHKWDFRLSLHCFFLFLTQCQNHQRNVPLEATQESFFLRMTNSNFSCWK